MKALTVTLVSGSQRNSKCDTPSKEGDIVQMSYKSKMVKYNRKRKS